MDCIQYVNSKDIRKHLYELNYEPNAEQQLYLIINCHHLPFEQKIAALTELKASTKDRPMSSVTNPVFTTTYGLSLHEFIDRYLADEKKSLSFMQENSPDCFYRTGYLWTGKYEMFGHHRSYKRSLQAIRDHATENEEDQCFYQTMISYFYHLIFWGCGFIYVSTISSRSGTHMCLAGSSWPMFVPEH